MDNKELSPCDYVMRAMDNQPKPLTREMFLSLLEDFGMKFNVQKVREHGADAERYKRLLPAVTWQARFNGQLRKDENAEPTGFFCLDVDIHHEAEFKELVTTRGYQLACEWAEAEAKRRTQLWAAMQREEEEALIEKGATCSDPLNIVGIHISPSGMGAHVIACCDESCQTIAENQARLARLLGTSYDEVCKDWARIMFLCPKEDWTYLDMDNFFSPLLTSPKGEE